jgi:AcrR family transcriptional regulator
VTPPQPGPGLRELKKQRTRAAIQSAALDLIARHGYDSTTCEQIAAAAGVSTATFFRYFPTKEDALLRDDYDPLIAAAVTDRPAEEPPVTAVRRALARTLDGLPEGAMDEVRHRTRLLLSVPALRARVHEQSEGARESLAGALAARTGRPADDLGVQALAAACAAALAVGVERWARDGGPLADHVDIALAALEPPSSPAGPP